MYFADVFNWFLNKNNLVTQAQIKVFSKTDFIAKNGYINLNKNFIY